MELYKSKYSDRRKSGKNYRTDNSSSRSFRNSNSDGNSRYSRDDKPREFTTVTCADCGTECQVPFVPRTNRPVFCSDCFRQNKPQDSGNSRYSRDYKNSHSSKDAPRSRKSKNDKFLKKQENFFSNGSDKFYASLKEKLFEILGGKVCSNCGFANEKALGFSHKFNENSFDNIGRGGAASSWGKYISEPELAREELDVLCLNCNEIKQHMTKPKDDYSKSKKKSRRFPR